MTERDPDKTNKETAKDFLSRHRIIKACAQLSLNLVGWPLRKAIREQPGLLEGSIIHSNTLFHPDTDGTPTYTHATGIDWLAYDFLRPKVLRPYKDGQYRQFRKGRLYAFLIDEVQGNKADDKTPLGLLQFLDIDHILGFEKPSIETLVNEELVIPTTYGDAYKRVGEYERYAEELESRQLTNDAIHQVTPKGNTLIFLGRDGGKPKPKKEEQPAWSSFTDPALGQPAH